MVRSASPSPSSSSLIPCMSPVFAFGALDNRGTSFGEGLTAFGRFIGCGLEGDGRSVEDAEEERWWDDAEDGKGCEWEREEEERMEENWVRNFWACYKRKPCQYNWHNGTGKDRTDAVV